MGVVVDMILTVAAVARAFGAIAEFEAGIGDLGPPADRAAEAGAVAGAGRVIDRALFDRALPAFLRRMPADEVGQEVGDLLAEEQDVVQQGDDRQEPGQVGEGPRLQGPHHHDDPADDADGGEDQVDQAEPLHLDRDDEIDAYHLVRQDRRHGQKEAQVDIMRTRFRAQEEGGKVGQQDAAEIIDVQPQGAPILLQDLTAPVIEEQADRAPEEAGFHQIGQRVGDQTPDLSPQDGGAVKDQQIIEQRIALIEQIQQVDHDVADGNEEHQVSQTPVPVLIKKPVHLYDWIFHRLPSIRVSSSIAHRRTDFKKESVNKSRPHLHFTARLCYDRKNVCFGGKP